MAGPHKVFYRGSDSDFIVFVEDPQSLVSYKKDSSIPIVDVLSVYKVFTNRTGGADGIFDEASKSELLNEFGKLNKDEVILKILKEGADRRGAEIHSGGSRTFS